MLNVALFVALCLLPLVQGLKSPEVYFNGTDHGAYIDWYNARGEGSYSNMLFLPSPSSSTLGVAIHWKVEKDSIRLGVAARSVGWVGFGIAESGGMRGADVILFTAQDLQLVDAHVLDELLPITDDCNNWILQHSQTRDGFLIFEATRLLDTGDPQDRVIINDTSRLVSPHRIIAAWGDTPTVSYHGVDNRVRGTARFFAGMDEADAFQQAMQAEAEGSFDLRAKNHLIAPVDTEYPMYCLTKQDLINLGLPMETNFHFIGVEPIIEPDTAKYVHHFSVYASLVGRNITGRCWRWLDETVFVWAPGEAPLMLPDEVGGPLGVNGFNELQIEIHYDNPWQDVGKVDNSGVRMYYTTKKRQYDLGILQLGDPNLRLFGSPVGNGLMEHRFSCPGSCSQNFVQNEQAVTVFRENLHMHRSGLRMNNKQIRNGEVLRRGTVDYFDFEQQGNYAVVQPSFQIKPGDSFETSCSYSSIDQVFGISSQQEMCMAFLMYYPRQTFAERPFVCGYAFLEFPICNAPQLQISIANTTELGRSFGRTSGKCVLPPASSPTLLESSVPTATTTTEAMVSNAPSEAPVSASSSSFSFGKFLNFLFVAFSCLPHWFM